VDAAQSAKRSAIAQHSTFHDRRCAEAVMVLCARAKKAVQ
jgi:hypothetical protein